MYRLANGEYFDEKRIIQKIISEEMIRGIFTWAGIECNREELTKLKFPEFNEETENDEEVERMLDVLGIDYDYDIADYLLNHKIPKMIEELKDEENEYTFDEVGEWIIHSIAEGLEDLDEDSQRFQDVTPFYGNLPLTDEEMKYLFEHFISVVIEQAKEDEKDECTYNFQKLEEDDELELVYDDKTLNYLQRQVDAYIKTTVCFWKMSIEVCEDSDDCISSPIYWDTDYLMISEEEIDEFRRLANSEAGKAMGLVTGSEDVEPISGSIKDSIR